MVNPPISVSVVIPTHNRASLLGRSIKSVLGQTYKDFEIIVVDDASTDNTEEVVQSIRDPRIRYLRHEKNRGGSAARNTGIRAAWGQYIAFQDSDDEWLPEKLEKQMEVLAAAPPEVGIVYTAFWRIRSDNKEYIPGPEIQLKEGRVHRELLKGNFVTTQAVLVKRECFQKAGMFDETLPRFQDWELFIRMAKHYEFRYVPEALVRSFFTEDSISAKPKSLIAALEIILHKHVEDYKANEAIYFDKLIGLANMYRLENNPRKSRQFLIEAITACRKPILLLPAMASFLGIRFLNLFWPMINKAQAGKFS
jgi:glycosyltransferase involved in cell wall biosynthesis